MDSFVEFVLFYIYFDFMMVFQVLLSSCGVFTNLAITDDQVNEFLQKCKIGDDVYVKDWIVALPRDKERRVPIAGFFEEFHTTSRIIRPLRIIKESLINKMITHKMYLTTLQRIYFYCSLSRKNEAAVNFPEENCCDHLSRVLFTNRSNPYHYDYEPFSSDERVTYSNKIISTLRYRYGYSSRPLRATCSLKNSRSSLKSTRSTHSTKSEKKKEANSLIIISDRIFDSKPKKKNASVCSITQINAINNTPDVLNRKLFGGFSTPDKKDETRKLTLDSCTNYDEGIPANNEDFCKGSLKVDNPLDQFE